MELRGELERRDPALYALLCAEEARQRDTLEMIASESAQSPLTLALQGSAFCGKTAVGGPGHQRLGGSENADALERLTAQRACEVFGAEHADILPYSGSVANYCGYAACVPPGGRILALDPAVGSHQTHGGAENVSTRFYRFAYFGLDRDTMLVDYDAAERAARDFRPHLIIVGSASYSRNFDYERLASIAHRNGARLMIDMAHTSGLAAAGVSPSPVPWADIVAASGTKTLCGPHTGFLLCKKELADAVDRAVYPGTVASLHLQTVAALCHALRETQTEAYRETARRIVENARYFCEALQRRGFGIVSGGTDCHLFVASLAGFGADAERFAALLERAHITVNTKRIPYDDARYVRGIRAGTTLLTQRGMGKPEIERLADVWQAVAQEPTPETAARMAPGTLALLRAFPLPGESGQEFGGFEG